MSQILVSIVESASEVADFQLTEVAGVGCIVRVMTDRRTL
jgi:hypothetical protein